MIVDSVFVGYPIEGETETHVFIERNGEIIQRCDSRNVITDGSVMRILENEYDRLVDTYEAEFCQYCIRNISM